jgi:hypothetical protein
MIILLVVKNACSYISKVFYHVKAGIRQRRRKERRKRGKKKI